MVDDDGSGMTGTIINNAWKQEFYNQIDALAAQGGTPQATITNADTGTLHNWAPTGLVGKSTVIYWTGAAPATISGIAGGVDGQILTIRNRSGNGSAISFPFHSAASNVGNRLLTLTTSGPTPVCYEGYITLAYIAGAVSAWVVIGHEQGAWIAPSFLASAFSGYGGMTWTVESSDVWTCAYLLEGRTLHVSWFINNTVIGGTLTNVLYIANTMWGGYAPTRYHASALARAHVGATAYLAHAFVDTGSAIVLQRQDAAAWTAGTAHLHGSIRFDVN